MPEPSPTPEILDYIRDRRSWMQYAVVPEKMAQMGVRSHRPVFTVSNPSGPHEIRSMLTVYEVSMLYMLARDYYEGHGEIVDLGPLVGLSTNAFARGLSQNRRCPQAKKTRRIHSFDLFSMNGYDHFFPEDERPSSASVFMKYLDANRDYLDHIAVNPGDLLSMNWGDDPIEILFVDVAKSWELNDWVVKKTFPCLIPERSIVIQQDYVHFNEYWIHITMEYIAEYFELFYMMHGATAVYRSLRPIPADALAVDLRALPIGEKNRLLESARAKAPEPVREVLKTAHAKCLIEHECFDQAVEMLRSVDTEPKTEDPTLQFANVARDNAGKVDRLLQAKSGRSAF